MPQNTELLRAYLIVGADELKRATAIKRLKARLDTGLLEFNLDEKTATAELTPDALIATLETIPFGADFRLVIIHEADKLAKASSEALVSYLKNPNPGCVLCLEAESLSKATRLYKAVAAMGKHSIVDCAPKKSWELPSYVQQLAQSKNLTLNTQAAEQLISLVGTSTLMLNNTLDMLKAQLGQARKLSAAEISQLVARVADVKPWTFLDALSERKVSQALELYYAMQKPSHIALHAMLVGRLRELICAEALSKRGSASLLATSLGKQGWQVKHHLRWSQAFAPGELEHLLIQAARCEYALKTSSDQKTAFISFLLAFQART